MLKCKYVTFLEDIHDSGTLTEKKARYYKTEHRKFLDTITNGDLDGRAATR
jgi:hypothetical protein